MLLLFLIMCFNEFLRNDYLRLCGKVGCSAGFLPFLYVCDWFDAANFTSSCEQALIQTKKILNLLTE